MSTLALLKPKVWTTRSTIRTSTSSWASLQGWQQRWQPNRDISAIGPSWLRCPGSSQGSCKLCSVLFNNAGSPTLFEGHALHLLTLNLTLPFADTSNSNNTTLYWMFTSMNRYLHLSLHFHFTRLCRLRSSNIYHTVSCFPWFLMSYLRMVAPYFM